MVSTVEDDSEAAREPRARVRAPDGGVVAGGAEEEEERVVAMARAGREAERRDAADGYQDVKDSGAKGGGVKNRGRPLEGRMHLPPPADSRETEAPTALAPRRDRLSTQSGRDADAEGRARQAEAQPAALRHASAQARAVPRGGYDLKQGGIVLILLLRGVHGRRRATIAVVRKMTNPQMTKWSIAIAPTARPSRSSRLL